MKKMIAGMVAAMTITGAAANMGAATADKDIIDTAVAAGSFKTRRRHSKRPTSSKH